MRRILDLRLQIAGVLFFLLMGAVLTRSNSEESRRPDDFVLLKELSLTLVTTKEAKVRDRPNVVLGKVIDTFPKHARLQVIGYAPNYWLVRRSGVQGYVSEMYVPRTFDENKAAYAGIKRGKVVEGAPKQVAPESAQPTASKSSLPPDYKIIRQSKSLPHKVSYDVLVTPRNNRLPAIAALSAVSHMLKSPATRTFVLFWLPGMEMDAGAYATAHHQPGEEFRVITFPGNLTAALAPLITQEAFPGHSAEDLAFWREHLQR